MAAVLLGSFIFLLRMTRSRSSEDVLNSSQTVLGGDAAVADGMVCKK